MSRITFAEPLFLYLLALVPAMIAICLNSKNNTSLRMPGLQQLQEQQNYGIS
jgi:hypothetical protein